MIVNIGIILFPREIMKAMIELYIFIVRHCVCCEIDRSRSAYCCVRVNHLQFCVSQNVGNLEKYFPFAK
jgi:hypothetical protein